MHSRKIIILSLLLFIATLLVFNTDFILKEQKQPLAVLGKIQDFQLTNQDGREVTLKSLNGKIWVADFIFTTCGGICPVLSGHMAEIYKVFNSSSEGIRFVSISVNPENDTPEVLNQYAKRYAADSDKWVFLTGPRASIQKLAVESFKLGSVTEPIFHSSYFTLVDRYGLIRGYYDGTSDEDLRRLINDAGGFR